jgi:hypothetical protein
MIPASGAGGHGFDSRITPSLLFDCSVASGFREKPAAGEKKQRKRKKTKIVELGTKKSPYWDSNPESPAP